jgi:hypothetical protein
VKSASRPGKGLAGLDQHEVRRRRSWYRWVTLAMLAYAFLGVAAVTEHARHPPPLGLIPLTATRSSTCSPPWSPYPWLIEAIGCAGRGGDAAGKPALAPSTTDGKPPSSHEHHDLRLEY